MATTTVGKGGNGQYPAGTGYLMGAVLAIVIGVATWLFTGDVVMGVIILAALSGTMGVVFEQVLDTRPLTPRQERTARALAVLGIVVGLIVLVAVVLL